MERERNSSILSVDTGLLERYFDQELGLISRLWVQKVVLKKPEARAYLEQLETLRDGAKEQAAINESQMVRVDLWDRVASRIHQEEKAAFYLGDREKPREWSFSVITFKSYARWGLPALAMAMLAIVLVPKAPQQGNVRTEVAANAQAGLLDYSGSNVGVSSVSANSSASFDRSQRYVEPQILEPDFQQQAVEVDWMRSDGRLFIMPIPGKQSTIVWVKRNPEKDKERNLSVAPLVPSGVSEPIQSIPVVGKN